MEEGESVRIQKNKHDSAAPTAEAGLDNSNHKNVSVGEETGGDGMEDVYAIGFQELVDLTAVNVAIDIRSQARNNLFR